MQLGLRITKNGINSGVLSFITIFLTDSAGSFVYMDSSLVCAGFLLLVDDWN